MSVRLIKTEFTLQKSAQHLKSDTPVHVSCIWRMFFVLI